MVPADGGIKIFLIADVRGYTKFTQEHGDEAAARLAMRFADLAGEVLQSAGGEVVELRGDEALVVFTSPRQALRAAVELQARFAAETSADPTLPFRVGIGLDAGEAVPVEGGYRGAPLNVAARLCALATPGEVLASQEVVHLARRVEGLRFYEQGPTRLKGIARPVTVIKVVAEAANPYKGLRAFDEADAPDFFGREALTEKLVSRLSEPGAASRFLAVVGPSGSGKSSVVRAGLVPALRHGALPGVARCLVAMMVPGTQPMKELAAALDRAVGEERVEIDEPRNEPADLPALVELAVPPGAELVLVIDQFEELFTLVEDEAMRTAFLESVRNAVLQPEGRLRVVVTLRADFYDRPLRYRDFGELVGARTQIVTPLSPQELDRAITGPAERAGVALEPGLVAQIVADVSNEPGALPLLQYALTELFEHRRGNTMALDAYHEVGGVSGALVRRAESLYLDLDPLERDAARQAFLRLTSSVDEVEVTRRRVPRDEVLSVGDPAAMEAAIEEFGAARLLSFDRDPSTGTPTVEVAHEALLVEWSRLRGWLEAAREDLRTERRLAAASREWVDAGRDDSFLVTGSRLVQFESWQESSDVAITPVERDFLEASVAERDRRREEEDVRQARERALERRSLRRTRSLVAVLAAAALVASGLTVFAFNQRGRAERESRVAVARELAAATVANLEADPERSILLALEAVRRTRSVDGSVLPEVEDALHRAVHASRVVMGVPDVGGALDWSAKGMFVTEGPEESGLVDIRDAETGESIRSFKGHEVDINFVAFSADGSMLATTGDDGFLRVWDPESGRRLGEFRGDSDLVLGTSFSPDGSLVAAAWIDEHVVRVWDVATGRLVRAIRVPVEPFTISFSPDGRRVVIGALDTGTAGVFDVRSGRELFLMEGHEEGLNGVDWSPNGRWIATSSNDSTVRIWNAGSGKSAFTLFGHTGPVSDSDWSPDSGRLVTGGADGTAKLWEISDAGAREEFSLSAQANRSGVWGVAFSPDGNRVLTGALDITSVHVWDVADTGNAEWANLPGIDDGLNGVAFAPDGRLVASGPGELIVWDPERAERTLAIDLPEGAEPFVDGIDVSPDGELMAAAIGGQAAVWNLDTSEPAFDVPVGEGVFDVAWSPDGRLLATARFDDGLAQIVDASGKEVASLREEDGFGVASVRFSPDGRLLATAGFPMGRPNPAAHRVKLWDWKSGRLVQTIQTSPDAMAFDPNGSRIAIASPAGAELWDIDTGEKIRTLTGGSGGFLDIAFSPDGRLIAAGGLDGSGRIWDAASGVQRLVLPGDGEVIADVAFSTDGAKLATSGFFPIVRVWALDLDDLIGVAEDELTRGLTDEECRQYLHQDRCAA